MFQTIKNKLHNKINKFCIENQKQHLFCNEIFFFVVTFNMKRK